MLSLVIGILSGLICTAPFIISKVPSMEQHLAKVMPFAGWIGVSVLLWGVFEVFGAVTHMGMMTDHFVTWIFWLLTGLFDLGAGLILGSGLVMKWTIGSDPAKQATINEKLKKLTPFQLLIGIGQIVMSVLYFVF